MPALGADLLGVLLIVGAPVAAGLDVVLDVIVVAEVAVVVVVAGAFWASKRA